MPSSLHFPRPRSVLHIIPLRTAAEFITFTLGINKITGFYGILALLTGFHLNPLQLSHYLYSLAVLGLALYLSPAIRGNAGSEKDTLKCLTLAWVYVVDAVVNGVYTGVFGFSWFVVLAQHSADGSIADGVLAPGGEMMNDTAGFTSPSHTVSAVTVVATPAARMLSGEKAVAFATPAATAAGGSLGAVIFDKSSLASIGVLALLWLLRVYFCVVMLSFARSTLRRYVASTSQTNYSTDAAMADNPFSAPGFARSLGRAMIKFPTKKYWLGKDESGDDEEWVRATSGRFESGRSRKSGGDGLKVSVPAVPESGVGERERRARSGTGPPQHHVVGGGATQAQVGGGKPAQ